MKLKMKIHKIKCIEDLEIEFPIDKGLYAITGQNGSGKSTIAACASTVFFHLALNEYFGKTEDDSSISFELDGGTRSVSKVMGKWEKHSTGIMNIKGFYEGSLIFGNRFRDTSYDKLRSAESIDTDKLIVASEFIRTNLGNILQGNPNFYEKLWLVSSNYKKFDGDVFFYEKNGKRISQFHMSTGENLLISILNSLYIRNHDRASLNKPCVIFLDEIELALHPASLKRLIAFLENMAQEYNYAIYFSTHSIELISGIKPDNIFYIERHADNTIEIINPCYPAYATRILYDHSGYDNVILVEDDLAKEIINLIIKKEHLYNNRLVHILPCGGYANVIDLADDVIRNNLLGKKASVCIVLDGDIKETAEKYIASHNIKNNIPLNYLPIESLEKYLRTNLYLAVDHTLFRLLNDYIFQQKSLKEIIKEYTTDINKDTDKNGKCLYKLIDTELRERKKDRLELIETIVDYIYNNKPEITSKIREFLKKQLS